MENPFRIKCNSCSDWSTKRTKLLPSEPSKTFFCSENLRLQAQSAPNVNEINEHSSSQGLRKEKADELNNNHCSSDCINRDCTHCTTGFERDCSKNSWGRERERSEQKTGFRLYRN